MRDGFGLTSEIFDEFGQSSTNASFVQALTDRLDTQAMLVADQRINDHLDASCEAIVLQEARAPGGFNFDRSDPAGGVANIMEAFATDEDTARCIFEAWGDVSQVPPEELTPELFNYEICGTSIFALISGDNRFTGQGG